MPTPLSEARSGTAAFDFSLQVRKLQWGVGVGFAPQNFFLSGSDTAAFDVFTNSELRRITVLLTNHKVEDKWQMLRAEPE